MASWPTTIARTSPATPMLRFCPAQRTVASVDEATPTCRVSTLPITLAVMGSVETRHVGVASSTLATVRWAGQNLSIGVAGLVLAIVVGQEAIVPAVYPRVLTSVRITFGIFTALCALGVAAALVGPGRWRR